MADTPKVQKFGDVVQRVRQYQEKMASESKEASNVKVPETDPTEKGTQSIPTDAEASKKKQNMPSDNSNESSEGKHLEDRDTHPASTGKDKVKTTDGTAKDEAATGGDPTVALSKIASRAKNIVSSLKKTATESQKNENNKGNSPTDSSTADTKQKKAEVIEESSKEKKEQDVKDMKSKAATSIATNIEPNPEFLFKLASTILETEGGLEAVEPILRKAAGIEAAQEIMTKAASAYDNFVREGYHTMMVEKQASEQQAQFFHGLNEMLKSASESDRGLIMKIASVHQDELSKISDPILKQAYMQGSMDAAAMQDAGAEGGAPTLPGSEGGEPSPEQIIELLQAMIQAGEIDEQTAAAIVQELQGAMGGGGAPPEGGDPAAAEAEAAAAAAAGGGGAPEEKMASTVDNLYKELTVSK
jgi:hypothetical protein